MLKFNFLAWSFTLAVFFSLTACIDEPSATGEGTGQVDSTLQESQGGEVNVYTHRHYDTDKKLFEQFQLHAGVKVNVVKAKADELINRLEQEGDMTKADILITVDAGRLYRAKEKGLLQQAVSEKLSKQVSEQYRDEDQQWYGLTRRARVVVYAPDRVNANDIKTYKDLADPKWKGRLLVRSSENIYNQSLMAAYIAHYGKEEAVKWAKGIVNNMARTPSGNDRDQVKAIAAGKGDIAIVNTYYIGKLLNSDNPAEQEAGQAVEVLFPTFGENGGTHINVSGAGITKHAPNKDNAKLLLEFLTSPASQRLFAGANFEYPVHPEMEPNDLLKSWGDLKADTVSLNRLGALNQEAIEVFDEAGWQ